MGFGLGDIVVFLSASWVVFRAYSGLELRLQKAEKHAEALQHRVEALEHANDVPSPGGMLTPVLPQRWRLVSNRILLVAILVSVALMVWITVFTDTGN